MKTKIFLLTAFSVMIFSLGIVKAYAFQDPYVTTYTETWTTTEYRWVDCEWYRWRELRNCNCGSGCGGGLGRDPGESCEAQGCTDCGNYGWDLRNTCTSEIWCDNGGSPPDRSYWEPYEVPHSKISYKCHYIDRVDSWSECSNGTQVASAIHWTEIAGQSCSNVPLSKSCFVPTAPTVSPFCKPGMPQKISAANISWDANGASYDVTISGYKKTVSRSSSTVAPDDFVANIARKKGGGSTALNLVPGTSYSVSVRYNTLGITSPEKTFTATDCSQQYICTGTPPTNATICPGDDTGLLYSNVDVTLGTACTDSYKCEYICTSGYKFDAATKTCVADTNCGILPAGAKICPNDDIDVPFGISYTSLVKDTSCTDLKCEYCPSPWNFDAYGVCKEGGGGNCTGSCPDKSHQCSNNGNSNWHLVESCSGETCGCQCDSGYVKVGNNSCKEMIPGKCGTSGDGNHSFCSAPTSNLCDNNGSHSSVTLDNNVWTWTCYGTGMPDETCTATKDCTWQEVNPN